MNKLHLSRNKIRLSKLLEWGGFAAAIPAAFSQSVFWIFVCAIVACAGAGWIDSMYRCPHCRQSLFASRGDALKATSCTFCPKCGWKVDIEMEA